jgi:hypothetical protein
LAGTVRRAGGVGPGMVRSEAAAAGAVSVEDEAAGAAPLGRGWVGAVAVGAVSRLTIKLLWSSLRLPGQLHTPINNNSSRINKTQRRLPLLRHGGIC